MEKGDGGGWEGWGVGSGLQKEEGRVDVEVGRWKGGCKGVLLSDQLSPIIIYSTTYQA